MMTRTAWSHLQQVSLGTRQVMVEDEEFVHGFDTGYDTCHTYHHHTHTDEVMSTDTFLFLLRNGWGAGRSDQWTTGYIMGWLAAFYEQEEGQLALSTDVSAPCDREGGNL